MIGYYSLYKEDKMRKIIELLQSATVVVSYDKPSSLLQMHYYDKGVLVSILLEDNANGDFGCSIDQNVFCRAERKVWEHLISTGKLDFNR